MGVAAGAPQGVRLRLASAFRDRFGEIGEQHGEPQPGGDLAREGRAAIMGGEVAQEERGDERRHDFGHENDRVLHQRARIEFAQRVDSGGGDDRAIEQVSGLGLGGHENGSDQ